MDGWVGQWVNGWDRVKLTKNLISLELIKIIQFSLKGGWLGESVSQWVEGVGQINRLNDVACIKIIQFCLKIYGL